MDHSKVPERVLQKKDILWPQCEQLARWLHPGDSYWLLLFVYLLIDFWFWTQKALRTLYPGLSKSTQPLLLPHAVGTGLDTVTTHTEQCTVCDTLRTLSCSDRFWWGWLSQCSFCTNGSRDQPLDGKVSGDLTQAICPCNICLQLWPPLIPAQFTSILSKNTCWSPKGMQGQIPGPLAAGFYTPVTTCILQGILQAL